MARYVGEWVRYLAQKGQQLSALLRLDLDLELAHGQANHSETQLSMEQIVPKIQHLDLKLAHSQTGNCRTQNARTHNYKCWAKLSQKCQECQPPTFPLSRAINTFLIREQIPANHIFVDTFANGVQC